MSRISVLVIEDEAPIRKVLKYNLERDGFEVHLAANGKIGLEIARKQKPQSILLDWLMPEMDGLQVLAELKQDEITKNIPVFMLTAKVMPGDVGQAIIEGVDGYFAKPFDATKLGQTLKYKLEDLVKTEISHIEQIEKENN